MRNYMGTGLFSSPSQRIQVISRANDLIVDPAHLYFIVHTSYQLGVLRLNLDCEDRKLRLERSNRELPKDR